MENKDKYFYVFSLTDPNGQSINLKVEVLAENYEQAVEKMKQCIMPGEKRSVTLEHIIIYIPKDHNH